MNIITRNHRLLLSAVCGISLSTAAQAVVSINFNANNGGFTSTLNTATFDGPWIYGATSGSGGSGGWSTDGQGPENSHANTTDLTSGFLGVTGAGGVVLSFDHRWSFEDLVDHWDAGAVFLSVNGGAFSQVPGASFTANGYNGTLHPDTASELKGLSAFVSQSAGYVAGTFLTSTATLGTFAAGDTLRIRFRGASDTNTSGGEPDWVLDNISLSNANVIPEPSAALFGALGLLGLVRRRRAC